MRYTHTKTGQCCENRKQRSAACRGRGPPPRHQEEPESACQFVLPVSTSPACLKDRRGKRAERNPSRMVGESDAIARESCLLFSQICHSYVFVCAWVFFFFTWTVAITRAALLQTGNRILACRSKKNYISCPQYVRRAVWMFDAQRPPHRSRWSRCLAPPFSFCFYFWAVGPSRRSSIIFKYWDWVFCDCVCTPFFAVKRAGCVWSGWKSES